MKKIRKLMSALLAMSMVFAMLAVNASAATHNDESEAYPVKVRVLTQEETDTMSSLALSKYVTGTAYLPKMWRESMEIPVRLLLQRAQR